MNRIGIETRSANGLPIVALAGELDLSQVGVVEQALRGAERARPDTLVLDLSGLTFLDSSGLRLVLEADRRARVEGRRLAVVPGPEAVHRVFLIALLDKRLEFIEQQNQVPQVATKAVEPPAHEHVKSPPLRVRAELVESRSLVLGP